VPIFIDRGAPEASALDMADESDILDFLRADFARIHERFDRTETRVGELTTQVAAIERELGAVRVDYASTRLCLENMDRRIERIGSA
jgi:hypothetical protein